MREAVSDILVDRSREAAGLTRMVVYSLVAHALLITAIVLLPDSWRQSTLPPESATMIITLGGTPGPATGGMTSIADRQVQQVVPPDAKPTPQPAPAAKVPEMVAPSPIVKPAPAAPAKPIEKPDDKSSSRKPTTGTEIKTGSAKNETGGAQTEFGGLKMGGGGAGGATVDVQNFCCPAYLVTMTEIVRANWNQNQNAAGNVKVKFTVLRDGRITAVEIEEPSGLFNLDQEARRALLKTSTLPPLPREFTEPTLTIHLIFEYKR